MKLSPYTLQVLKNFSEINTGIKIKEGNVISIISPQKNIFGSATVADEFPQTFALYDLPNFLSVLSLHGDGAELNFDEKYVVFVGREGRSRITYRYTDEQMIITPPDKTIKLPTEDVSFKITQSDFEWIKSTAKVLQSSHIAVENKGEGIYMYTFDPKKDDAHTECLNLDAYGTGSKYRLAVSADNFSKMFPLTYDVTISSKGIAKFVGVEKEITYHLLLEDKESHFNAKED